MDVYQPLGVEVTVGIVTLQVVVTQMNGADHPSESIHALHVGKMRMKLRKGKTAIAKEYYSAAMQVVRILDFVANISLPSRSQFLTLFVIALALWSERRRKRCSSGSVLAIESRSIFRVSF